MRHVILAVGISLDCYIARPNGAFDFLYMPKDFPWAAFMATVDTAIMGRKTFDVALQHGDISSSPLKNYVLSRSQPPGERDGVVFVKQSPTALISRLRRQRGKNIWLMGGGELAREFLKADLVDELHFG